MHHRNKNPDETTVPHDEDCQESRSVIALGPVSEYSDTNKDQFLPADSSKTGHTHLVSCEGKTTLFNMRFPAESARVSKRNETQNEEADYDITDTQRHMTKDGKRSGKDTHVTFQEVPEIKAFEFVQKKATRFSQSASSSDFNLGILSDKDDDGDNGCEDIDTSAGSDTESVIMFHTATSGSRSSICSQDENESLIKLSAGQQGQESHFININEIKRSSSSEDKTQKSDLLDKSLNESDVIILTDFSLPGTKSSRSDIKNTVSSTTSLKQHSAFTKTFDVQDADLKPSAAAEDGGGVCSESSELTEVDSSIPPPQGRSVTVIIEQEDKTVLSEGRALFEQTSELASVFTEFVNVGSFRASQRNKNLHAENSLGDKEEHLQVLLSAGSVKGLKSYLRNSLWPAESRSRWNLWENLCVHLLKAKERLYQKLVDDMLSQDMNGMWTLPSTVDADNAHSYFLTTHGVEQARTVVSLISSLHPDITYCPLLYPMSCLFLHYMSPEACFSCIQALLRSKSSYYFMQTKIKAEASKYVLRDLARKYAKKAYSLIVERGEKCVESVFVNWMWWIFRDLPFQYLVRIIDSFLLEGYKILYRISLAIVILFAQEQNKSRNYNNHLTDIHTDISRFCKNLSIDPRKLIKVGFGIRGLSRSEITNLHEKNETYVRSLPLSLTSTQSSGLRLTEQVPSSILSPEMLQIIWEWIPVRLSLMKPTLLFSSEEHGTAIRTLYTRTEHASQTILVIKTTANEVFGAFCSSSWYIRHEVNKQTTSFFGTGETFVFSISPVMKKYTWTGMLADPPEQASDLFMAGDDQMLIIGSGNGQAIYLDAMLNRCSTSHCDTFNNKPLCSDTDFSCRVVEVFGFIE